MAAKAKTATGVADESVFTKAALVSSKRFAHKRDLVSAMLEDGKEYTIEQVESMIHNYLKGEVK